MSNNNPNGLTKPSIVVMSQLSEGNVPLWLRHSKACVCVCVERRGGILVAGFIEGIRQEGMESLKMGFSATENGNPG